MRAVDAVSRASREMMRVGSRSFDTAARLLDPAARESARNLYAWCRYLDDVVDGQALGQRPDRADTEAAAQRLQQLRWQTLEALAGLPQQDATFVAFQRVVQAHAIPSRYPLALLDGFAMDVEGRHYGTIDDTLDYCYHVAGVVGVMMARILEVEDDAVLDHACDLGLAFQLTNIARDVVDDWRVGRVYLPADWLTEAGLTPASLGAPRHRAALFGVVKRLLDTAEPYYESAAAGIAALPPRPAWAIATARDVYRAIGTQVLAAGPAAWDGRPVVPFKRKLACVVGAGARVVAGRILRRPQPSRAVFLWSRPL
jgi:phytoene synthase